MTKQSVRAEVANFIQGFITEASPLNFPTTASLDEENFQAHRTGLRRRRLGMDFERGYKLIPVHTTPEYFELGGKSSFLWESAGGVADNRFIVVQVRDRLFVFDSDNEYISDLGFLFEIELVGHHPDPTYSFASVDGSLVVATGAEKVVVIHYDNNTKLFSTEEGSVKVRDLWGVEVVGSRYETEQTYREASAPPAHIYNLRNQSWAYPRGRRNNNNYYDPVSTYRNDLGVFPSNSESVWSGITFDAQRGDGRDPGEIYMSSLSKQALGAEPLAPKGHFIIDLLRRGESRMQQVHDLQNRTPELVYHVGSLPLDRTEGGPRFVAEYSGRVWFAGFGGNIIQGDARSPDLSSYIAYSQLVKSPSDLFKCYQDGDPSSRDASDILDTDGGFIRISGAYNIASLKSLGKELIVVAENGVWAISGGGGHFTGTNYEVSKLSSFGSLAARSVVVEGDNLYYWAEDGINMVHRNEYGDLMVTNLTQTTIQSFYDLIHPDSKVKAVGEYNPFDRKVRWLYREGGYSLELIYDTALQAFYKNRIYNPIGGGVEVFDIGRGEQLVGDFYAVDVVVGGTQVVSQGKDVISKLADTEEGAPTNRYMTMVVHDGWCYLTFSLYRNYRFRDWMSHDGIGADAKAFMLTGAVTGGESSVFKQMPYLTMHFNKTEEGVIDETPNRQSSCLVRTQWDWANSPSSGKWQPLFQAYRYRRPYFVSGVDDPYNNGFDTVTSRNKIRGRGRAFSLYMETEPDKDCQIIGWVLDVNGNQKV